MLGEQAVLSNQRRSHSIRSLEECKVAAIHREVLRDLVQFGQPLHCAEGKEMIEKNGLLTLLCKTQ